MSLFIQLEPRAPLGGAEETPPPDNSGHIMQINSPPWLRGQAQWGAGKIKLVLVLSGCTNVTLVTGEKNAFRQEF
jgi:hypothetical protein